MSTIQVNGKEFEYVEKGQGDPLVLVHGTLGDYRSWEMQFDKFAEHYRVISYSRRYHYPNSCTGEESDYSAILHADDLSAILTGLGLQSAHIVGNSYGAYTALFLAWRHPKQVLTLVLPEPPILPLLDTENQGFSIKENFQANTWLPAGKAMELGEPEKGISTFIDSVVSEGAFDSFPSEVQQLIMDNACEFKAETTSPDYWTPFSCEDAKQIQAPTLLLTGEKSLKMLKLIVEELQTCLPNNEMVEVPSSSHEMASENPDFFNDTVLAFLKKHAS